MAKRNRKPIQSVPLNEISRDIIAVALERAPIEVVASGCHIWLGATFRTGYGMIGLLGRAHKAHRVSWTLENGPIPDGMCVCHRCDIPLCINPAHLFLGTQSENMLDCLQKGRPHGVTKLTKEDAAEILASPLLHREIAQKYSVTRSQITHIKSGTHWHRLTQEPKA